MKILKKLFFVIIILFPLNVYANIMCKDGTISPSCTTCSRGCCSHHGGCANKKVNSNTSKSIVPKVALSNDASLASIIINGNKIAIKDDNIVYNTSENIVTLVPIVNHKGAKATYEKNVNITEGSYKTEIIVMAEDKRTTKKYNVTINRLSDNIDIKIFINKKEVIFNNYIGELNFNYFTNKIDIDYELKDSKSTVQLDYDKKMNTEEKEIVLVVESESGKKQTYKIKLHRESKKKMFDNVINIFNIFFKYIVNKKI